MKIVSGPKEPRRNVKYRIRESVMEKVDRVVEEARRKGLKASQQKVIEQILEQALSDKGFVIRL